MDQERIDAVVEGLRDHVDAIPSDWWPARAHQDAMVRRWELGTAVRASKDEAFVDATFRALRSWKAFRGATVPRQDVEDALVRARPALRALERVDILDLDLGRHAKHLLRAFEAVADVKPTARKWMASSKLLYHLLPDVVVPMDNLHTPLLLGRQLPAGIEMAFLEETYETFVAIAGRVGRATLDELARDPRYSVRLGLARVIDFAIVGYARVHAHGAAVDRTGVLSLRGKVRWQGDRERSR